MNRAVTHDGNEWSNAADDRVELVDSDPRKDRMFFVKGMPPFGSRRTHHVHVRVPPDAAAELSFRDLLRTNPALARGYAALKENLATRYPYDRDAYTDGKRALIAEALGHDAA